MINRLNDIVVEGTILAEPTCSHTANSTNFYKVNIAAESAGSDKYDNITLIMHDAYLDKNIFKIGQRVKVQGELSSYEHPKSKKSNRYVYVHYIMPIEKQPDKKDANEIRLEATVCKVTYDNDVVKAHVITKKQDKIVLSIICNLTNIPEEIISEIKVGNEYLVIGQYRTYESKWVDDKGTHSKKIDEIMVTDIFC